MKVSPHDGCPNGGRPCCADLTPREIEVAELLARRRTAREIAKTLEISHSTARRHTEKVLSKLGLHSRTDVEAHFATIREGKHRAF